MKRPLAISTWIILKKKYAMSSLLRWVVVSARIFGWSQGYFRIMLFKSDVNKIYMQSANI